VWRGLRIGRVRFACLGHGEVFLVHCGGGRLGDRLLDGGGVCVLVAATAAEAEEC
jgi:hypothetical protein